jgi:DNA-binding MarR family transcriptional regulator
MIHLLHRAGQRADELFSISLGQADLTPRQYIVIQAAAKGEGASQTTLVEATGIDRSTLADIVRRLVERGLLLRKRTRSDARMYAVRLTAAGREALKAAEPASRAADDRLLAALPAAQRAAFIEALSRIVGTMGPISGARVQGRPGAKR